MSCFSRLLGLICAVVPGLLFLAFSVLFFTRWSQLGMVTGPLYSLVSFITGAVCLYLGIGILFGRDRNEEPVTTNETPQTPALDAPVFVESVVQAKPMQAAPLPIIEAAEPVRADAATPSPTQSIFASSETATAPAPAVSAPPDTPEMRIRQLAQTRSNWKVTAPQLAQLANLNMGVADATARAMVNNGHAQMQIGPNGETIYIFDLAS